MLKSKTFYLASRNLWRNPTRTMWLVLGGAFCLVGLVLLVALVRGLNEQRLLERLETSLGHIKMTDKRFLQHKPADAYFELSSDLTQVFQKNKQILAYTPRLNVRASIPTRLADWLAVDVYGIDATKEKRVFKLHKYVRAGQYLAERAGKVLVGRELARSLQKGVGDTLTLYFPAPINLQIIGIYEVASADFSRTHLFVHEGDLRKVLGLPAHAYHQILFKTTNPDLAYPLARSLSEALPALQTRSWQEIAPDLAYMHILTSFVLGLWVLLVVVVVGILQYILLQNSWQERLVEWQRLSAWGLTRGELLQMWALELGVMVGLGMILGTLLAFSGLTYFAQVGLNLAYFGTGLAKAGYGAVVYPVLWFWDMVLILGFMSIVPICQLCVVAKKLRAGKVGVC